MNTLTGYSKNKLSDNYLLTAAGGHLAAGVENGSAAIYVSWPTYAKLKELNYIDANYGTGDYGHPDEEFLKGICKWAIANYSGSSCTLLGAIAPNSSGTCCMHLYGNSGFDATTKLPRYCMGWYQTLEGNLAYFGTSDYVWKYSRYASVADVKNPVNYYWANVPISDKSSTTTSPTVNTITANNYITFGTYGARFTSDIRDSWRTSIYGDTTNQSRLRTVRTDVTIADFSEHYGSGLAWASGDTQGYLSVSHASGKAWIGGGNSNKLNWSTELITGKNIANQSVKQATTATKWATARTITLNGLLQGSVSLDGSLNVTLTSYNYHCIAGSSATNNYPYHLIMKCDPITGLWVDLFGLYRITQGHKGGNIGVFYVVVKTNSGTTASTCEIGWIYRKGFAVDAIQAGFYDVLGNTYIDVFCKTNSTYIKNTVEQISITKNRGEIGRGFTLQSSSESFTLLSDKSYITNTSKTTSYSTIASGLTNAAGGNALRTYTSIISATDSQAHIYLATIASKLGSSTLGGTYQPIYLSSGTATACTSYAKAIKSITRSGTTFTYTRLDGTTGTFTQLDNNTTYSFTSGVDKFTVTPSSGSAINVNVGTLLVNGTYTGGGGQQRPSYIGNGKVRWNMMRATTDYFDSSPFSGYCDWMMMDTYDGSDVPYVTMIGVLKSATPRAYIASGTKGDSSGKWTIKTLLDSGNSSVSGGGSTWGSSITVNINGTTKTLTIPAKPTIPTVTDYYWANIKVSETESTTTTPTFGSTVTLNSTGNVILNLTRTSKSSWRFLNNSNLIIQNNYTSDVVDYFDVVKIAYSTGNVTLKGSLTASSSSNTVGIPLVLKNSAWYGNMSTAIDFYNGGSYTVPNARIATKMNGDGKSGGTLIFYTLTAHATTNPNPNGLTERMRIGDNGIITIAKQIEGSLGSSWIKARDNAVVKQICTTSSTYLPVVSMKTASGSWSMGTLGSSEKLIVSYDTDENYNANTNSNTAIYFPTSGGTLALVSDITKSQVGLGNVQNTAFYKRVTTVNGTPWDMAGTTNSAAFTIYAPTTAGTSGQVLVSTGGTPTWLTISTGGGGYIGTTAVQATSGNQAITGITGVYTNYSGTSYGLLVNNQNANVLVLSCGGGLYVGYTNTSGIYLGNVNSTTTHTYPLKNNTYYLGSSSSYWKEVTANVFRSYGGSGTWAAFYLNTSGTSVFENSSGAFYINSKNLLSLKANSNLVVLGSSTAVFYPNTKLSLGTSDNPWGDIYGTYKGCLASPAIIWCGYLNREYQSTVWNAVKEGGLATLTFNVSDASIRGYISVTFTGHHVLGAFCTTKTIWDGGSNVWVDDPSVTGRSGGMGDYMINHLGSDLYIRKFKQQNSDNDTWNNEDLSTTTTADGNKPVTAFNLIVFGY